MRSSFLPRSRRFKKSAGPGLQECTARPGDPILLFVGKIPPEALRKHSPTLLRWRETGPDALCKAAGVSRGDLQKLTDSDVNTFTSGTMAQLLAPFDADNPERDIDNREEATGFAAGDVRRVVEVDATFRISKKP